MGVSGRTCAPERFLRHRACREHCGHGIGDGRKRGQGDLLAGGEPCLRSLNVVRYSNEGLLSFLLSCCGCFLQVMDGGHSTSLDAILDNPLSESMTVSKASEYFSTAVPGVKAILSRHALRLASKVSLDLSKTTAAETFLSMLQNEWATYSRHASSCACSSMLAIRLRHIATETV